MHLNNSILITHTFVKVLFPFTVSFLLTTCEATTVFLTQLVCFVYQLELEVVKGAA